MDFLTLHRGRLLFFYLLPSLVLGGVFAYFIRFHSSAFPWLGQFSLGATASLLWQLGVLCLRIFSRNLPPSLVTTVSMVSVLVSFLGNLSLLAFLVWRQQSETMIFGFLIAYIFHLVLLVFASYCSASKDP